MISGNVDVVAPQQRADPPDDSRDVIILENDQRSGRHHVDVVVSDPDDPRMRVAEQSASETQVTSLTANDDLLAIVGIRGQSSLRHTEVPLARQVSRAHEVHLIGPMHVAQESDEHEGGERFQRIIGIPCVPDLDFSHGPGRQGPCQATEVFAQTEKRSENTHRFAADRRGIKRPREIAVSECRTHCLRDLTRDQLLRL